MVAAGGLHASSSAASLRSKGGSCCSAPVPNTASLDLNCFVSAFCFVFACAGARTMVAAGSLRGSSAAELEEQGVQLLLAADAAGELQHKIVVKSQHDENYLLGCCYPDQQT
eukprot:939763-Pelagomonas_calceolata.AAC.1